MVFPQSLVYVTMFHALHQRGKSIQDQQMRMFALVFIVVFVYQVWPPPLVIAVYFSCLCIVSDIHTDVLFVFGNNQVFPTVLFPTINSLAILCA